MGALPGWQRPLSCHSHGESANQVLALDPSECKRSHPFRQVIWLPARPRSPALDRPARGSLCLAVMRFAGEISPAKRQSHRFTCDFSPHIASHSSKRLSILREYVEVQTRLGDLQLPQRQGAIFESERIDPGVVQGGVSEVGSGADGR